MKRFSPLQWHNLAKSFTLFFILLTLVWSVVSLLAFGDIYVSWYLLGVNLLLSALLAWFYYKHRYHTRFSYDEGGFEMIRGRLKISGSWREFGSVSLVHLGGGRFAVRLYRGEPVGAGLVPARVGAGDFLDIPASDLQLNPPQFRFEVMTFLKESGVRP